MLTSSYGLSAPFFWRCCLPGKNHEMRNDFESSRIEDNKSSSNSCLRNKISGRKPTSIKNSQKCDSLFIYKWPLCTGEFFVLQDHMAEYLRSKSFKRKYRDIPRRPVDVKEREYLKKEGAIEDNHLSASLIALKVDDVLDAISQDFPIYSENTSERAMSPSRNGQLQVSEQSASAFNSLLCKRRCEYNCCFDLQTMQVHFPARTQYRAPAHETAIGSYPVSLIQGQYQDYYARYSSTELNYLPLKTCIYNFPMESRCWPKCETVYTAKSEVSTDVKDSETKAEAVPELSSFSESLNCNTPYRTCGVCACADDNELLTCSSCMNSVHPSCVEMSKEMIEVVKTYDWQCMNCKRCSSCHDTSDEEKMMFCDQCDRGYHTFCVGLGEIPNGVWRCVECLKPPVTDSPLNESPPPKRTTRIRKYKTNKKKRHGIRGRPPTRATSTAFGYGVHDFYYASEKSRCRSRKSRIIKENVEQNV